MKRKYYFPKTASISLFSNGAKFQTETFKPSHEMKPGKRKNITGWSSKSRKRMREFLLNNTCPDDYLLFGSTFTLPGPLLSPDIFKVLWRRWCNSATKNNWLVVWRVELQARKQPHWHCLIALPKPANQPVDGLCIDLCKYKIWQSWLTVLRNCPPYEVKNLSVIDCSDGIMLDNGTGKSYKLTATINNLLIWQGSEFHSVDVQYNSDNRGSWLRYLQDHSTKAKQEQIAVNIGRHWGVIGRKKFKTIEPDEVINLTGKQYSKFLRLYHRLCTPHRKCSFYDKKRKHFIFCKHIKTCPVASLNRGCLSWSSSRGRYGSSVWFSSPETVKRLAMWALSD